MAMKDGPTKIGISIDPTKRLDQVRAQTVGEIGLAAQWRHGNSHAVEQAAHKILADRWAYGEWFSVDVYTAFDAISKAMREIDSRPVSVVNKIHTRPVEVIHVDVDLGGRFRLPVAPDLEGSWPIGYVRQMQGCPAGKQFQWMVAAGIRKDSIYVETAINASPAMDLCLTDCRAGDVVLAWTDQVFPLPGAAAEVAFKGARIIYAVPR